MEKRIYDVYWEGPFKWDEYGRFLRSNHVLYALYGAHHLYGRDVLLYIGRTEVGVTGRLSVHAEWVEDEYEAVSIRVASVGAFTSWETWEGLARPYPKERPEIVRGIEALLIYSHQPAYNAMSKVSFDQVSRGIRAFNSGRIGQLLPEVSYLYHYGDQ